MEEDDESKSTAALLQAIRSTGRVGRSREAWTLGRLLSSAPRRDDTFHHNHDKPQRAAYTSHRGLGGHRLSVPQHRYLFHLHIDAAKPSNCPLRLARLRCSPRRRRWKTSLHTSLRTQILPERPSRQSSAVRAHPLRRPPTQSDVHPLLPTALPFRGGLASTLSTGHSAPKHIRRRCVEDMAAFFAVRQQVS